MGKVAALWTKVDEDGATPIRQSEITLVAGKGVVGDRHFGNRKQRQILLVDTGCLQQLGLQPGELREQITVDFEGLQNLPTGAELQVGNATVRISGDCAPCRSMARYLGEDPQVFVNRAMRKRGMLGIVSEEGTVRVGDAVTAKEPAPTDDTLD